MSGSANFDELSAFLATAYAKSFSAAAKQLGRDASVISRRVSQLEQRLGVQLLKRTTRSVTLTEAGTVYYQRARIALEELETAGREAATFGTDPQGVLKVSLPVSYGREVIAPILPLFIRKYPRISLDLVFLDRVVDVVAEGYDVVLRSGAIRDSSLLAKKIDSFGSILVASPDYLEKHGCPQSPSDLHSHACLGFTRHLTWPDWVFVKNGESIAIRPTGPMTADNAEALLTAALGGIGISLAADWLAAPHVKTGRLAQVLVDWKYEVEAGVYAVMPPGGLMPSKTRAFVDELIRELKLRRRTAL